MALLCWSGGSDSTKLLIDLARAGKNPRALSFRHPQVNCYKEQSLARERVKRWMRKQCLRAEYHEVETRHSPGFAGAASGGGNNQSIMWLVAAVLYLEPAEDLYLGYNRGDEFWHVRADHDWAFT